MNARIVVVVVDARQARYRSRFGGAHQQQWPGTLGADLPRRRGLACPPFAVDAGAGAALAVVVPARQPEATRPSSSQPHPSPFWGTSQWRLTPRDKNSKLSAFKDVE